MGKTPKFTIGSQVSSAANAPVPVARTAVQPSAIVRAGDALGVMLWRAAPVAAAIAREFGPAEPDREDAWPQPVRGTSADPDHPMWDKHYGRKGSFFSP